MEESQMRGSSISCELNFDEQLGMREMHSMYFETSGAGRARTDDDGIMSSGL